MTIEECTIFWAMQCKEPLEIKWKDKTIDNPRLENTKRWLLDNFIAGKRLEMFCYFVLDNYKPTSNNPYPANGHLTEIFELYKKTQRLFNQETYTPLTFEEIEKVFSEKENVKIEPPDGMEDIDINILAEDEKKNNLKPDQMLKKYGFRLCGELWSEGVYRRRIEPKEDSKNPQQIGRVL